MKVYLKGIDGRSDQTEEKVKEVVVDDQYIHIKYEDGVYGMVTGVIYYKGEMEITRIKE